MWQVRRELTARLCGEDAETCPILERGGLDITTTLDWRLQEIAEKWVKAADDRAPREEPEGAREGPRPRVRGVDAEPAHEGPPQRRAGGDGLPDRRARGVRRIGERERDEGDEEVPAPVRRHRGRLAAARVRVQADRLRRPASTPATITAASMFMDVVTDFGGGYTPTDADRLERGPGPHAQRPPVLAQHPRGQGARRSSATTRSRRRPSRWGSCSATARWTPALSFALGVEEVRPLDLVRAYGVLGDAGRLVDQTTIITVDDHERRGAADRGGPRRARAGHRSRGPRSSSPTSSPATPTPGSTRSGASSAITDDGKRRPATLKTGTNNDAKDLNAYGYIARTEPRRARGRRVRAGGGRVERQLGQLGRQHAAGPVVLDRRHDLRLGGLPRGGDRGLEHQLRSSGPTKASWPSRWIPGPGCSPTRAANRWRSCSSSGPRRRPTCPQDARCGEAVLQVAGFEAQHASWMRANEGWLRRARAGTGRPGRPGEHPDRLLLQQLVQPVRPLVGSARR